MNSEGDAIHFLSGHLTSSQCLILVLELDRFLGGGSLMGPSELIDTPPFLRSRALTRHSHHDLSTTFTQLPCIAYEVPLHESQRVIRVVVQKNSHQVNDVNLIHHKLNKLPRTCGCGLLHLTNLPFWNARMRCRHRSFDWSSTPARKPDRSPSSSLPYSMEAWVASREEGRRMDPKYRNRLVSHLETGLSLDRDRTLVRASSVTLHSREHL